MIRPYWLRHQIQLRIACFIGLFVTPFAWVVMALWECRDDLFSAMQDCFMLMIFGADE